MAEHPYMPFYPEKFISDTSHVPWDAAGAYALLLMHAWARGGSLPDDENQLRLMVRCHSKAWNRVWQQIAPFWALGGDGRLHQKRMDLEWKRVREVRARRAAEAREKGKGKDDQKPLNDSERKIPDGKKTNDIYARARTCPPLNILTENSLSKDRESSQGAPASLSVRAHASPDAPSPEGETEPSPPLDDAARARIAAGLEKLARSIVNPDRLNQPAAGTVAELKRNAAAEKLAQWAANPLPALSPTALASPRLGYVNGNHHALPKTLPLPGRKRRARRANGGGT